MRYEIKRLDGDEIIFSYECDSLKTCVEAAVMPRANLSRADLSGADLSGADLSRVNLYGANLFSADLSCANLHGATLSGANLSGANLYGADLSGANLYGTNLSHADLYGANLSRANLYGTNLYSANLSNANLSSTNLACADLSQADLAQANLSGANLSSARLTDALNAALPLALTSIVPQEGAFVGWKKLKDGIIAKLVIPHDAKRVNAVGSRKCRASKVFVHEMYEQDGAVFTGIGISQFDGNTRYETGKETFPDKFDPSITEECSHGISFFLTREEAEAS